MSDPADLKKQPGLSSEEIEKILGDVFKNTNFAGLNNPQKTATAPQKTAAAPQKTAVAPEKTATAPEKTAVAPEKTATAPEKTATAPEKTAKAQEKAVPDPQSPKSVILAPGQSINAGSRKLTVRRHLSSGGEGELYLVTDSRKEYALKLYHPGCRTKSQILSPLQKLNGKGFIADIIDFGEDFELTEYIPEGNAADTGIKGNAQAILAITVKTAAALDRLHKLNILHKDIKPANILIKSRTTWDSVLCDFGISEILDIDGKCTTVQGRTPIYAAPEIYTATITLPSGVFVELSTKSDFYSLGMSILSMWMGEKAFRSQESQMAMDKVKGRIRVPSDMPDPLARICRGLLIKNPAKRWDYPEIERTLNGEDVPVEEDEIIEDLNITFSASKHLVAHSPEELADCMIEDIELAKRYLYRGQLEKWLKPYPELALEMQEIVEKRYPKDQNTGALAAIYALNPTLPLTFKGSSRKGGEACSRKIFNFKDVGNFCNDAIPDGPTWDLLSSDIFLEWVRCKDKALADRLPASKDDVEVAMVRVQILDPLSDLNLINDPSDELYAMTGESLGRLLNEIYTVVWNKFHGDLSEMSENYINDPLSLRIIPTTVFCVAASILHPDYSTYLSDSLKTKGDRFTSQISWIDYCTDYESADNKKKAGPKDENYLSQAAWMKIIKGFGHTPQYRLENSGKTVTTVSELFRESKSVLRNEYENNGLGGWLAVQHHENPDADLSQQFTYEKLLKDYLEDLRRIDDKNTYVTRFDSARQQVDTMVSSAKKRILALNTRNTLQLASTVILAILPAIQLVIMLIMTIVQSPLVDTSGLSLEKFFWPVGLVVAAIVFFTDDNSSGCIIPIIAGGIVAAALSFVVWILGKFILYIFLAVVLGVGGYLTWKTLLNPSSHRKQMRKLTKPGFDELVLEPLYYAFSDEDEFDSSLSIDLDESALNGWKDDLKKRRIYVLVFIASVWILVGLSSFVPNSWIYDKVVAPVMEQTETPAAQEEIKDLITVQSLNPGDKGENVRKMQQFLIRKGYLKSAADGDYGTNTRLAVRTFQRANGIKVTGKADKRTIRKINELAAKENSK